MHGGDFAVDGAFAERLGRILEAVERGFGVFVDGADSGDQAGVEERFHAGAELFGGLFGGVSDVGLDRAAASLDCGAIFGVERGELGHHTLRRFGNNQVDLNFGLALEFFHRGAGGSLELGANVSAVGVKLRGGFARNHLLVFHQANKLAVGDASGGGFEIVGGASDGLIQAIEDARLNIGPDARKNALRIGEAALRFAGEAFEALRSIRWCERE